MTSITTLSLSLLLSVAAQAEAAAQQDLIRITGQKVPMDPKLASLCAIAPVVGPHVSPTIHLYVNQLVLDYRRKNPDAVRYPVGSVFYKEKYDAGNKATMATIMTRIADNNRADDWRYEMITLPSREPARKIDTASCQNCHERYDKQGFISKTTTEALETFLEKPAVAPATQEKPKTE